MDELLLDLPPADSADLESYSGQTLLRPKLPSFGSAVPPPHSYSRKLPGLNWTMDDVLVLDEPACGATPMPRAYDYRVRRERARRSVDPRRYEFIGATQFVCMLSTPFWAFALVLLMAHL